MIEAARLCGVDRRTMLRWVRAGRLPSVTTPGGHHRILCKDLVVFMNNQGIPVPKELSSAQEEPVILVIDDQALVREAIVSILAHLVPEARVVEASSGFDAGILVARELPQLVILDIVMPGMDGIEVLRRLRSDEDECVANTNVIVLSGQLTDGRREALQELGVLAMLDKPAPPLVLASAIARCGLFANADTLHPTAANAMSRP